MMHTYGTQMRPRNWMTGVTGFIVGLILLLMPAVSTGASSAGIDSESDPEHPPSVFIDREEYFALLGIDWQSPYAVRASLELTHDDLRFPQVRAD